MLQALAFLDVTAIIFGEEHKAEDIAPLRPSPIA
jgi:hypothetical protein